MSIREGTRRACRLVFTTFVGLAVSCGGASTPPPDPSRRTVADNEPPPSLDPCAASREERSRVPGLLAEGKLDRAVRVIRKADAACPTAASQTRAVLVLTLIELDRASEALGVVAAIEADAGASAADRAAAVAYRAHLERRDPHGSRSVAPPADADLFLTGDYTLLKKSYLALWQTTRDKDFLFKASLAARAAGDHAEAQRLLDRLLASLGRVDASGKATRVLPDLPVGAQAQTLAWSPDGRLLAVGGTFGVRVFEGELTPRPGFATFEPIDPNVMVVGLAFSADSTRLASLSAKGDVVLWDVASGIARNRGMRAGHAPASIAMFAFASDDTLLFGYSDGQSKRVRLDELGRLTPGGIRGVRPPTLQAPPVPELQTTPTAFSKDGNRVAFVASGQIVLKDAGKKGSPTKIESANSVTDIVFADGGEMVATVHERSVRIWDAARGTPKKTLDLDQAITSVVFGPADATIIVGRRDAAPVELDVATGSVVREYGPSPSNTYPVALSPDGRAVASLVSGGGVQLWDVASGKRGGTFGSEETFIQSAAFCSTSKSLALAAGGTAVTYWDGRKARTLDAARGRMRLVDWTPDGKTLITLAEYGLLRWDMATAGSSVLLDEGNATMGFAVAPDGRSVAAAVAQGNRIQIVDLASAAVTRSIAMEPYEQALFPTYDATGARLAALVGLAIAPGGARIGVWDVASGRALHSFPIRFQMGSIAFSPDNSSVFFATSPLDVLRWDLASGESTGDAKWSPPQGAVQILSDDRTLVFFSRASDARGVTLWDLETRTQTRTIGEGHMGEFAFQSGEVLGTKDRSRVRLWRVSDGAYLGALHVGSGPTMTYFAAVDGRIEILNRSALAELECAVGEVHYPFAVCEERVVTEGLLAAALAGHVLPDNP